MPTSANESEQFPNFYILAQSTVAKLDEQMRGHLFNFACTQLQEHYAKAFSSQGLLVRVMYEYTVANYLFHLIKG